MTRILFEFDLKNREEDMREVVRPGIIALGGIVIVILAMWGKVIVWMLVNFFMFYLPWNVR